MSGAADIPLVAVEVPQVGDDRRKNWAKVVASVDDRSSSGWAFEGEFVATGGIQDLPVGSVLLVYGERGSRMNPQVEAKVYTVNDDGTLSHERSARGKAWARTLRDVVGELLSAPLILPEATRPWHADLMGYSDDALQQEMERRRRASPGGDGPRPP